MSGGGVSQPPLRWQRIVLPSFLALPMLAAMLALGIWQVQRMGWKSALLQELAAAQLGRRKLFLLEHGRHSNIIIKT